MKKTLINLFACSAILLGFAACSKPDAPVLPKEHKAQVVDYRNKNAGGTAIRSARTAGDPFSWKLVDVLDPFDTDSEYNRDKGYSYCSYKNENGETVICDNGKNTEVFDKMKNAIKFEDCEDGIKLIFTKPADYDKVTWIVFQYVDGNGNRSTSIDSDKWNEIFDGTDGNGNFEIIYPLVSAGKEAHFWVMLGNNKETEANPNVSFFYEVMPEHGLGVVDDMQEDYRETDYISMEDGHTMNIKMLIPPYAKNLKKIVTLHEQNGGTYAWYDGAVNKIAVFEDTEDDAEALEASKNGEEYIFDMDLSEKDLSEGVFKNNSHVFVSLIYRYTMEDEKFDGYFFATPEIKSLPVANTYFKSE